MDLDKHALLLGQIIGNLQSLEFALRVILFKQNKSGTSCPNLDEVTVGDLLDEDKLTDYSTLNGLITEYNSQVAKNDSTKIDVSVIDIRDALAHGRVSSSSPTDNMRIIKFSKPQNGQVKVVFSEVMSESWMDSTRKRVYEELQKIIPYLK